MASTVKIISKSSLGDGNSFSGATGVVALNVSESLTNVDQSYAIAMTAVDDSSGQTIDLYGPTTDELGNVLTFAYLNAIIIKAAADNTTNTIVGSGTFETIVGATGDTIALVPGATLVLLAPDGADTGYAVTAGSADTLLISAVDGTDTVDVEVLVMGVKSA